MYAKFLSATCYQAGKLLQFNRTQLFSPRSLRNKPPDWLDWARKETEEWVALREEFDIVRYSQERGSRKLIGKNLLAHHVVIRLKKGCPPTNEEVSLSVHYDVRYWGLCSEKEIKHLFGPFYFYEFTTNIYDDGVPIKLKTHDLSII